MEGPSRVSKGLWAEGMKERVGSAEGEGKTGDASVGRKGINEGGREGGEKKIRLWTIRGGVSIKILFNFLALFLLPSSPCQTRHTSQQPRPLEKEGIYSSIRFFFPRIFFTKC